MPIHNSHAGAHHALDIDGAAVESLKSVSGFDMLADVVATSFGPGTMPAKHVAGVQWTSGKAALGMGMGAGLYAWMRHAFEQGASLAAGTLSTADFNFKERSRLTFSDALLTSITLPRLDGASKEAGAFEIEFAPAEVRASAGDGSDIRAAPGTRQQPWLCANFRFELGSLPCARVASIESFTWRCTPAAATVFQSQPAPTIEVPDLHLSISAADYDAWADAAQRWFIDGQRLQGDEMSGMITLLTPDLQTPLGAILLRNVGFKRFSQLPPGGGGDALYRFTVDLYVERMALQLLQYEG
jgi:hypothetical protein